MKIAVCDDSREDRGILRALFMRFDSSLSRLEIIPMSKKPISKNVRTVGQRFESVQKRSRE